MNKRNGVMKLHWLLTASLLATFLSEPANAACQSRNSTAKNRAQPSATAKRVGSAVRWQTSLAEAQRLSIATGKPIFWYVPTLNDSFMDRKVEIDRYLRAGMFSWPDIIKTLNEKFVPLLEVPNQNSSDRFQLKPYQFVEPGFLILDNKLRSLDRVDRITTQHPAWLRHLLSRYDERLAEQPANELQEPWRLLGERKYPACLQTIKSLGANDPLAAEKLLLAGMAHFRLGRRADAIEKWKQASLIQPDHPLAWKAAAEAEGLGPFVRGFEVHVPLPAAALNASRQSMGSAAPPNVYRVADVWPRGINFLLGMQDNSGAFLDCDYDFGGSDSLPNVHVAVTSIVAMALLKASDRANQRLGVPRQWIDKAIEKAKTFALNDRNLNTNDSDELFWARAYRVRLLAASHTRYQTDGQRLAEAVNALQAMQLKGGSWYHEYPNPFVTGLALVALKEAQAAGASVDQTIVASGVKSLAGNRMRGGYLYNDRAYTHHFLNEHDLASASAGRSPLCDLGLHQWGALDNARLSNSIQQSFAKQSHLIASLKYDDHTSRHGYGGFFFWFDMHGRSNAIAHLPVGPLRDAFAKQQQQLIMSLPELDGCFVDSHELGRCYGTAMALLSLDALTAREQK